ncbi:virion core protein, T7 gp14 family [Shinella sumterensis]|uniref:virion core protein, T7 gp14 family n=1 Tax=Shinella sumterensis TaxID=1967501 RepID=UPI003F859A8D
MCDFITILGAGLGIAQSAVQYSAAQDQYEAQMEVQRQNALNASKAAENQYANINVRAQQEEMAAAQQRQESKIEAAKAASTVEVAASEGGVSGLSVDAVLRDIYAQHGRNEASLDVNQRMSRDYLTGELKAAEAGGQNQINSVPIPEKPSMMPYVLNAFGSGLNAYSNRPKKK